MSNIDFTQAITAADKATLRTARRADALKADCARRITHVLDMVTVINIQGAAIAGVLSKAELATFTAGRAWIGEMQLACRTMIADETADPSDDGNWPTAPDGISALAALY